MREALMLVPAAGFSYEKAAAIVRCAIGTIKSRVHRARWKLMEVLEMDAPRKFGPDHAISRQFMADGWRRTRVQKSATPSANRGLMRFHKAKRVSAIEAKWIIAEAPSSLSETIAICHDENWYDVRLMTKHELQEFVLDLLRGELAALQSGQMVPH
jgi:hypothetical protein